MKKLLFLFAAVGFAALSSCEGDQGPAGPPGTSVEAAVFERNGVDFDSNGEIFGNYPADLTVLDSDVVLIYRLSGLIDSTTPIWQQIPRTLYFEQGEIDYDFDFSREDYQIYIGGTFEPGTDLTQNQTFRIVVIPGYFADRSTNQVDFSNYNAVIKAYGIDDKNVQVIQ